MDLWTEFEGVTIDSAFALKKLLQTEGRSAFFSTLNGNGESVLIRIIECHFDEDEILARWRGVQTLGHPNFLRIDRFGQFLIEADDITAVYALFERVDANLGQVLERGRLYRDRSAGDHYAAQQPERDPHPASSRLAPKWGRFPDRPGWPAMTGPGPAR
jgi:hypothetical protein